MLTENFDGFFCFFLEEKLNVKNVKNYKMMHHRWFVSKNFSLPVCLDMTSVLKHSSVSRFFLVQKGPLGVDTTLYTTVSMLGPPTVGAKKLKVSFSLRNC